MHPSRSRDLGSNRGPVKSDLGLVSQESGKDKELLKQYVRYSGMEVWLRRYTEG